MKIFRNTMLTRSQVAAGAGALGGMEFEEEFKELESRNTCLHDNCQDRVENDLEKEDSQQDKKIKIHEKITQNPSVCCLIIMILIFCSSFMGGELGSSQWLDAFTNQTLQATIEQLHQFITKTMKLE